MEQELISIIVPVYNVEKYLDRCVKSIVNQTYKNLEIILIDDGSLDSSGDICDNWAKNDERVKVYHVSNGGIARVRNLGIGYANGAYISFIDSDDFIVENMISRLYSHYRNKNVDLVLCDFDNFYDDSIQYMDEVIKDYYIIDSHKVFHMLYEKKSDRIVSSCNKLFKKSIFEGLRYPEDKLYEDAYMITSFLDRCNKVLIDKSILYFRQMRNDSIMATHNKGFSYKNLQVLDYMKKRCEEYKDIKDKSLLSKIFAEYFQTCIVFYCLMKMNKLGKEKYKKLYDEFTLYYKKVDVKFEIKKTIKYFLFYHFPNLLYLILYRDIKRRM